MTNESNGSVNEERVREAYERVLRWQMANEITDDVDALVEAVRQQEKMKRLERLRSLREAVTDTASAGSVKAEETEGAKEGLGVGEQCVLCGHAADAHRSPAFELGLPYGDFCEDCKAYADAHIEDTVMNPRHPYAPPSAPVRPPNPIPDQVLTPLFTRERYELVRDAYNAIFSVIRPDDRPFEEDWKELVWAACAALEVKARAPLEAALREAARNHHYSALHHLDRDGYPSATFDECRDPDCVSARAALAGVPKEAGE